MMPLLNVSISGQGNLDLSTAIASQLTQITATHLGKEHQVTAVAINYVDASDWFIDAQPVSTRKLRTFSLDIKVTAGTNTKSEIAAYQSLVFKEMTELLGAIADESYIVVDEVPAPNWGFGGQTQECRSVAKTLGRSA
ncbi:MAG: hypothetical protein OQK24_04745 [Magnetovibrio sp.]|nr:hypothetical protein [Magnetovibrio sp.]